MDRRGQAVVPTARHRGGAGGGAAASSGPGVWARRRGATGAGFGDRRAQTG